MLSRSQHFSTCVVKSVLSVCAYKAVESVIKLILKEVAEFKLLPLIGRDNTHPIDIFAATGSPGFPSLATLKRQVSQIH